MPSCRERQLKLEKVRATQQYIEEFQKQQAEWRRLEREKIEAENRRIREFSSYQQQMEETRMAKIHEREQAKQHLQQMVRSVFHQLLSSKTLSSSMFMARLCHTQNMHMFFILFLKLTEKYEVERKAA